MVCSYRIQSGSKFYPSIPILDPWLRYNLNVFLFILNGTILKHHGKFVKWGTRYMRKLHVGKHMERYLVTSLIGRFRY